MIHVLIEGWRGISQSFAMVNQYQLLELSKLDGIHVEHLDLPFTQPNWSTATHGPGFPKEYQEKIASIPIPSREHYDYAYRITSPFCRPTTKATRELTFLTGEFGLRPDSFSPHGSDPHDVLGDRNEIVVPSNWSRIKAIEFGFPEQKIALVPLGVDSALFHPLNNDERQAARRHMGFDEDEFVFLNLGAMTWNKGIDILTMAYANVREKYKSARLVLKDDRSLYGISAADVFHRALVSRPDLMSDDLRKSVKLISGTLSLYQLRLLYGACDCYISPYRAEGFNLPVMEAIACGTPAIISSGGATDDFCTDDVASKVACKHVEVASSPVPGTGYFLEPDGDDLINRMENMIERKAMQQQPDRFEAGRSRLVTRYSWASCTKQLAHLMGWRSTV